MSVEPPDNNFTLRVTYSLGCVMWHTAIALEALARAWFGEKFALDAVCVESPLGRDRYGSWIQIRAKFLQEFMKLVRHFTCNTAAFSRIVGRHAPRYAPALCDRTMVRVVLMKTTAGQYLDSYGSAIP